MERKSRNAGMSGLARIKLHDSDIILVGDVDELPAVSAIKHIWHTFDTHNHEEGHYIMLPAYRWSLHWLRKHADWIPKEANFIEGAIERDIQYFSSVNLDDFQKIRYELRKINTMR